MRSTVLKLAIMLIVITMMASCAAPARNDEAFVGTQWKLTSIGSSSVSSKRAPTIEFTVEGVRGSAGCNSFQGSYSTSGQSIEFSELTMTLMACPDDEGVMDLEQRYFAALQQARSYEITSDQLSIATNEGTTLVFIKQ